jgi:Bacterial pullanase-associated domain
MQRRVFLGTAVAVATLGISLTALPAAAQAVPEVAKVPDGMISLHYYRPDGAYDGWGVHFWESFEKVENGKVTGPKTKSDMPVLNIAWSAPMQPTGKDGFGSYWQLKADEFRNGKYNYIIHRGDSKDCAKDSVWFNTQGKQVFINQGDCTAYFSVEEAIKARK